MKTSGNTKVLEMILIKIEYIVWAVCFGRALYNLLA